MTSTDEQRHRAATAWRSLVHHFARRYEGPGAFDETSPWSHRAFLWPFSQAMAAAYDLAALGLLERDEADAIRDDGLAAHRHRKGSEHGYHDSVRSWFQQGDRYYDDAAWVGLVLARAARAGGDPVPRAEAHAVLDFVTSGWDDSGIHPHPGGLFWKRSDDRMDRNVASTAPSAQLAARLYAMTGAEVCREWATRLYEWVVEALRDDDARYFDRIGPTGEIERTKWTYNQGSMIGAGVLLAGAWRGDDDSRADRYLAQAHETASASLAVGLAQHPGDPWFDCIHLRNLLLLCAGGEDAALARTVHDAATQWSDELWASHPWDDLESPPPPATRARRLLADAAAVQVFAVLGGLDPDLLV